MDMARTTPSRSLGAALFFWVWFLPLCGICLALIGFVGTTVYASHVAEQQRKEKSIAEASDVLVAYIASMASGNHATMMDDGAVLRFKDMRLVDRPKPAAQVGDRFVLFFEGLSQEMCQGISDRKLDHVEAISLNGGPFADRYDGSECRRAYYRSTREPNWIAVIRRPAQTP